VASSIAPLVAKVDAVDKRLGATLRTTERWTAMRALLTTLDNRKFADASEANAAHDEITNGLIDLILNYAGNYSNLILDPDLDSYWLMDAFVVKMPLITELTSELATQALIQSGDPRDRQIAMSGSYKLLNGTSDDLMNVNMTTAFKETKQRSVQELRAPLDGQQGAVAGYAAQVRQDALNIDPTLPVPPEARGRIISGALATIDASAQFYVAVGPKLDLLCATRVTSYSSDRSNGLVAAVFAFVVLAYLFAGFYISVRGSVKGLGDATQRLIAGTTEQVSLPSKDELGALAADFNLINHALVEARTLRDKVSADNQELQRNIMDLLGVVSNASDGDLTVRAIVSAGALGNVADGLNQLLESLSSLVNEIKSQTAQTDATVEQIRSASSEMERQATRQAEEVGAATALVQSITDQMGEVNTIASQAANAAKKTKDTAEEGSDAVQNVVSGMQNLRSNVQAGAKKMKNLGDRSMEITQIVSTIQRISEQTNMLALNAAIEAARAGEHGRGFTVVAEEVRKLAERTAIATQEIDKLVKAIHVETDETAHAIEQQTEAVEEEVKIVGSAGESLNRILDVSNESFAHVASIRELAAAQLVGTKKVVETMSLISNVSRATQTGARGTNQTISQLVMQSERLRGAVGKFKID
jgi:twitching motility protein PilJ